MRTAKILIRLGGCPGRSESSLGAQPHCWFCHEAAHISMHMQLRGGSIGISIDLHWNLYIKPYFFSFLFFFCSCCCCCFVVVVASASYISLQQVRDGTYLLLPVLFFILIYSLYLSLSLSVCLSVCLSVSLSLSLSLSESSLTFKWLFFILIFATYLISGTYQNKEKPIKFREDSD